MISDETLRDGQQQPLVTFQAQEMREIIESTQKALGSSLYNIDIMPSMHPMHEDIAGYAHFKGVPVTLATPMKREQIYGCSKLADNIIVISSLSDSLMKAKKLTRESNLLCTKARLNYAKSLGLNCGLAGEGTAEADLDFMVNYINSNTGLMDYFIYCDTFGNANPDDTETRISYLKSNVHVPILMHCHNDEGNAVDNTIAGILAGADGISTTFTGIGDRAGNAPTEEVLKTLKQMGFIINGVDYKQLEITSELVENYAGIGPAEPGSNYAKVHEAGIHVDAILKARENGEVVYNANAGFGIAIGVSSGLKNLKHVYEMYGLPVPNNDLQREILLELKDEAIKQKRSFSPGEVFHYIQNNGLVQHKLPSIPNRKSGSTFYRV